MKRISSIFSSPKTSFQILSDLHLHHNAQYLTFNVPVTAPYLILAGNIGRLSDYDAYLSFLVRRCNMYEKVWLVLGSLEFSNTTHFEGLTLAHKMEKERATRGRLEVLHRTRSDIAGTNFTLLGCSLWSHIPEAEEEAVLKKAEEFDTQNGIKEWDVAKHNREHQRDLTWLRKEVGETGTREVIIVSSFTPDLKESMPPWQVGSPWASAYGANLLDDMEWYGTKCWVYGATGRTRQYKKAKMTVVSNQRGQVGEDVTGFHGEGVSEKEKVGVFDVARVIKI
jgi:hypothetical protein